MRQLSIIFSCLIVVTTTNAQQSGTWMPTVGDSLPGVYASGHLFHQSGAIENNFVNRFLFGGHIDSTLTMTQFERMKDVNIVGFEQLGQFRADLFKSNKGVQHFMGFENRNAGYVRYHKNLYSLLFAGNMHLAGDSLPIEKTDLLQFSYLSLMYGVQYKNLTVSAGIHGITSYNKAAITNGNMYTSATYDQVSARLDGGYTSATGNGIKGYGINVNASYVARMNYSENDSSDMLIVFQISDLGFSYLPGKHLETISFNRGITWTGVSLPALIGGDTTLFDNVDAFTDTTGLRHQGSNTLFWHPAELHVGKLPSMYHTGSPDAIFGVRMRMSKMYYPYAYLGMHYVFKNHSYAGLVAGFGGFGGFHVGAYSGINLGKKICVYLSTDNLPGWFYGEMRSRGLMFGLRMHYK